jgi:GTPase SAR1 family protein
MPETLKVVVVGQPSTGKTALLEQFVFNSFKK